MPLTILSLLLNRYVCECPTGWVFDTVSAMCVDERRELCYETWDSGRCHKARPLELSRPECCCSEGTSIHYYNPSSRTPG